MTATTNIHPSPISTQPLRLLAGVVTCVLVLFVLLIPVSALAQQTFRDPAIPPGKTLGGQLIGTKSMGRFGISPHLVSNQEIDLGVRQIGGRNSFQLPITSGSQQGSAEPDQANGTGTDSGATITDPFWMQSTQEPLESISGVEVGREDTTPMAPTRDGMDRQESNISENGREIIRQRYPDGKVQIEREVVQDKNGNYVNHGFWRVKDREGKPIADGMYQNGKMHGPWQRVHTKQSSGLFSTAPFNMFQGPFISTAMFELGKLNGMWTLTDDYKQKIFEIPYRNRIRDGKATWWYPSLTRMREVTFKDGILDGKLLEWNQQRELVRNDFFREGRKIVRNVTFYRPKQMQSENYYLDGKLVLAGEDNWWDAKPAAIDRVGERVQHGPANLWFDNGLPKMRGQYVEGKRVGRFIWWHSNGNKQLEGGYVKGNKTGLWVWRHKNGMKAIEGSYEDDIAAGIWKWWDAEGNVKAEEDMDENQQAEEEDAKKEALNSILDSGSSEETSGSNEETPDVLPTGDSSQPTDSSKDEAADPYAGFEDISPIESENDEPATSKPANSDPANSDPANSEPAGSESAEDDSKEAEGSEGDFDTLKEYFSSRTDDT